MARTIRCPYCIQGNDFKVMIGRTEGEWFLCARCSHVSMPNDPGYECKCAKRDELRPRPK